MLYFPIVFKIHGAVKIGIKGGVIRLIQINPLQILAAGTAVSFGAVLDLQKTFVQLDGEEAGNLMEKHAVVISEKVLVNRRKAVKRAIYSRFLFQLAQGGFFHALAETDTSADGVIKRAFFIRIARHQHLSSAVDDHAHTVVEFSLFCFKAIPHNSGVRIAQ